MADEQIHTLWLRFTYTPVKIIASWMLILRAEFYYVRK